MPDEDALLITFYPWVHGTDYRHFRGCLMMEGENGAEQKAVMLDPTVFPGQLNFTVNVVWPAYTWEHYFSPSMHASFDIDAGSYEFNTECTLLVSPIYDGSQYNLPILNWLGGSVNALGKTFVGGGPYLTVGNKYDGPVTETTILTIPDRTVYLDDNLAKYELFEQKILADFRVWNIHFSWSTNNLNQSLPPDSTSQLHVYRVWKLVLYCESNYSYKRRYYVFTNDQWVLVNTSTDPEVVYLSDNGGGDYLLTVEGPASSVSPLGVYTFPSTQPGTPNTTNWTPSAHTVTCTDFG